MMAPKSSENGETWWNHMIHMYSICFHLGFSPVPTKILKSSNPSLTAWRLADLDPRPLVGSLRVKTKPWRVRGSGPRPLRPVSRNGRLGQICQVGSMEIMDYYGLMINIWILGDDDDYINYISHILLLQILYARMFSTERLDDLWSLQLCFTTGRCKKPSLTGDVCVETALSDVGKFRRNSETYIRIYISIYSMN